MSKIHEKIMRTDFAKSLKKLFILALCVMLLGVGLSAAMLRTQIGEVVSNINQWRQLKESYNEDGQQDNVKQEQVNESKAQNNVNQEQDGENKNQNNEDENQNQDDEYRKQNSKKEKRNDEGMPFMRRVHS